jgi:3-oxoacyl-[acyl-carrier-protein] synthase II
VEKRVVISGIGVVSSIGTGKKEYWSALREGKSGLTPITSFDVTGLKSRLAGAVRNFNAGDHLDRKGLKYLNRSTQMALVAAKQAFEDARLEPEDHPQSEKGVVMGVTAGHLESMSQVMRILENDPSHISPMEGPNTAVNIVTSHLAMEFKTSSFNTTLCNGYSGGLDALMYGYEFIKNGKAKIVLAGGCESISYEHFLGLYSTRKLSRAENGSDELSAPFDRRRNGFVYGEGCAVLILEDYDHAADRGADVYAELKGYGKAYTPGSSEDAHVAGACRALDRAVERAGLPIGDIGFIQACGNSSPDLDRHESKAIRATAGNVPTASIKGSIGECCSASGSLQAVAALGIFEDQAVPYMINYSLSDPDCDLNYVTRHQPGSHINHVLVNAFSMDGNKSTVVLSKVK